MRPAKASEIDKEDEIMARTFTALWMQDEQALASRLLTNYIKGPVIKQARSAASGKTKRERAAVLTDGGAGRAVEAVEYAKK